MELLDLEPIEVNIFRGVSPDEERQRVFGGQVAGQALVAAVRTVDEPDRSVHSLHAYFLRPGDPNAPILYEVDRIRDGRSFTTRRVVAIQHGHAIFNLQASFQRLEEGLDYQIDMPSGLADPDSLEKLRTDLPQAIDVRPVDVESPHQQYVWMRADGRLPDDSNLHTCVVTYASDITLLDTVLRPHNVRWEDQKMMMASLDHAMWFHRPFRADEWLLFVQDTPSTSGARGLARGEIFTAGGTLVVSVVQEGLVRPVSKPA